MIVAPEAPNLVQVDGGMVLKLTQLPGGTGQSSWIWNYARPVPGLLDGLSSDQVTPMDIEQIYCTKCYSPSQYRRGFKQFSTKGASVTSIRNHLKNQHNIVGSAKEANEGNAAQTKSGPSPGPLKAGQTTIKQVSTCITRAVVGRQEFLVIIYPAGFLQITVSNTILLFDC